VDAENNGKGDGIRFLGPEGAAKRDAEKGFWYAFDAR